MTLETERLLLRPFQEADGQALFEYLSDPETIKYEPYKPFSEEAAIEEAKRRAKDESFWAVCLKDGTLLGNLYFGSGEFETWELGYVFHRKYWGQGFAQESAKALLNHAFETLGVRRVIAMCNPENERSWRLMERLGMRREGTLLQNVFFWRDEHEKPIWQDTFEYAMLRDEYKKLAEG